MALAIDGPAQQQTLDSVLRAYFRQYVQNGPHRLPRLEEIQGQGPVGEADYLRFIARYAYEQEYHQSSEQAKAHPGVRLLYFSVIVLQVHTHNQLLLS